MDCQDLRKARKLTCLENLDVYDRHLPSGYCMYDSLWVQVLECKLHPGSAKFEILRSFPLEQIFTDFVSFDV